MPMSQPANRRLAAILAAEVAGYTRLMQADEEGTIRTWCDYREDIVGPLMEQLSGRIVKLTGDGFIAELVFATKAVQAAYQMQLKPDAAEGCAPQPGIAEDKRMLFRMGVNLGDIFYDDEDIYGDDVNIAARLEGLAEPGSVLISGAVFEKVKRTAQLTFANRGDQSLKNISEPVSTSQVLGELINHSCANGDPEALPMTSAQAASSNSIAVLPFSLFGGDPEQEYFADGFTEDLITELARFRELFVISRNATFALKGKSADVRTLGKQLGVAYCVEGSVRKMGSRLRINCQLIDAGTGDHVWAEKYDCKLNELFDVQDDLAGKIVTMVAGRVVEGSLASARNKIPADMQACECLLRGLEHHRLGGVTRDDAEQAFN